jgi:hypothetical protein
MKTINYLEEENAQARINLLEKSYKFSFASFQKAIMSNSQLRKQIDDVVDLGLFEFAIRKNTAFIQNARAKAEAETMELLMQFVNGVGDYTVIREILHRNRIIRALAIKDRKDQRELINKVTHQKVLDE